MASVMRFCATDFDVMPPPGTYSCTVRSARLCRSTKGNRMLRVALSIDEYADRSSPVYDYFVLEGISDKGIHLARRRIVQLYQACGLQPKDGDVMRPSDLINAHLIVKLEPCHDEPYVKLRVVSYRRC